MGGKRRNLWPVLLAAAIVVAVALVLLAVGRSPHRNDLATYWGFALPLVLTAGGWLAWLWRQRNQPDSGTTNLPELDHVAHRLAEAVRNQWEQAAVERGLRWPEPIPVRWRAPSEALAGPVGAAVVLKRFLPLPGLRGVRVQDLRKGDIRDLHAVYGGLGSGRLVIAGTPGSGKSGAAVLLVLAALDHRDQLDDADRSQVPVPVLFTAQGWDPRSQRTEEWLALRMQQTYPLFTGKAGAKNAAALIEAKRITLIIDGLDEIAEELRPVALQALSQQVTFRLVLLSRTAEIASAAASQRGALHGAAAVELQDIDSATAADYLTSVQLDPPPDGWRDLIGRIRSRQSPLAQALDSPLTLTLVRDTYRAGDDVRELLQFCDTAQGQVSGDRLAQAITGHLLDRVLPAFYTPQPGEPAFPYDLQTAQHALTKIAARMNQNYSRDLQWWHINLWVSPWPSALGIGLVFGLGVGLGLGLWAGLGLWIGLVSGILTVYLLFAFGLGGPPRRMGKLRMRRALSRTNLLIGLASGIVFGLLTNGDVRGLVHRLVFGLVVGIGLGILVVVGIGLGDALVDPDSATSLSPLTSWRADIRYTRVIGLGVGLVYGLVFVLVFVLVLGLRTGLGFALAAGFFIGFLLGPSNSASLVSSLAFAQLAWRWHTPIRLMRFLEDARRRGVLRTVGPVYQFRHARLQDRLAEQATASVPIP